MTEHEHCWHDSGKALLSIPPQYVQICCHCGEQKIVKPEIVLSFEGHGEFHPQNYIKGFKNA